MSDERNVFIRAVILGGIVLGLLGVGWMTGACYAPSIQRPKAEYEATIPVNAETERTRIERTRLCMGVPARIVVEFGVGDEEHAEKAIERAFKLLESYDAAMSDYRVDSDLSRVNAAAGGAAVKVAGSLVTALEVAREVSLASDGAFDATIGPASQLWRRVRDVRALPPEEEIAAVRRLVNWRDVEVDRSAGTVRLARAGMRLDLGGIGKGFAVQRAAMQLRGAGFGGVMVALSGDIALGDAPKGTNGWKIEVSSAASGGDDEVTLELHNCAVSTSGDMEQFVEIGGVGGRRYSHIVDPRTALGTPGGVMVTVISARGEWADALDTAAVVMLSRGESEDAVARMLGQFPGSRAIVERRGADGTVVRSEIEGAR